MPAMFKMIVAVFLIFFSPVGLAVPQALPRVQTYDELLDAIRQTRAASAQRIAVAIEQEKVREAWETGKLIDEHILLHKERAEYGEQVIERLAKDLGTSKRELHYMVAFARSYPIVPPAAQLSWSSYRDLLAVKDPEERRRLIEQAAQENWDRDTLRREIKRRNVSLEDLPNEPLEAKPGTLHTYRVVRDYVGEDKDELVIDLGFSNYYRPDGIERFKEGDFVKWDSHVGAGPRARPSQGAHRGAPLQKMANATPADLYTYEAEVIRVLDGDTFAASVDLGFGFTTIQTLRLRGLDAPEIKSTDGQEAKAFVESEFAKARGEILLKTVKSDKYDRYLADVWVAGEYLNQKLIDQGLAVRVSE